jgi:hypothetical protein
VSSTTEPVTSAAAAGLRSESRPGVLGSGRRAFRRRRRRRGVDGFASYDAAVAWLI